jgi:hypothetical protein
MLASFIAWALLSGARLAHSSADIELSLYTDHTSSTPSASNPNITRGLNVCAVTTGLESFVLSPVPCTSGDVAHWVFTTVACGDVSNAYYHGASNNNDCYAAYGGTMAAVMLTCDVDVDEDDCGRPGGYGWGVDGSPGSAFHQQWAAALARTRVRRLRIQ